MQCVCDWAILAEGALRLTYPDLTVVDVEADLIASMQAKAGEVKIPWSTVLSADAAKPGTTDAQNLRRLVKEALKPIVARLLAHRTPLLLINPGLLARYDQVTLLDTLRDAAGTASGPPGVWVLVPTGSFGSHPSIDGVAVPIIGSHQTMVLHKAWIYQHNPRAQVA